MNIYKIIYEIHQSKNRLNANNNLQQLLDNYSRGVNLAEDKTSNGILVILPSVLKFSGGTTSTLRIANYLAKNGYDVYVTSYEGQFESEMKSNAETDIKDNAVEFVEYSKATSRQYGFCIATNYMSVYYAKNISGEKIYFVQDFEPFFYPVNEEYVLALNSYKQGFHIITLGKWNKEKIYEYATRDARVDSVDFPYEPSEYPIVQRDYSQLINKKEYTMAVYIKNEGKRMPVGLQWLMGELRKDFAKDGKELHVKYFGMIKQYPLENGENLGKLSKSELHDLYMNSDFGVVMSMTNISLVPYEMIASGLPIIEAKDGSFTSFFPEDAAILTDFDHQHLYSKISSMIANPEDIKKMISIGQSTINKVSWDKTCEQFRRILETTP